MKELFLKCSGLLRRTCTALAQTVRNMGLSLFGRLSWNPPPWLSKIIQAARDFHRAWPRLTTSLVIGVLFLSGGGAWSWHWYQQRPKPHRVTVKVAPIPVTKLDKELKFPALVLSFSESAAALPDLKKPSLQGVRLEPALPGAWHWTDDRTLIFQPTADWPADQKFRILFEKKFFPAQVVMERLTYEAQTPPFAITVKELRFYQDPTDPTQHQITATFELTHAVEPGALDRHIQLFAIGGSPIFASSDPAPHFSMTYGLHQRLAYLRSSPIRLPGREDFAKLALSSGVQTSQGGAQTHDGSETKVRIPSIATIFQIDSIAGTIARNKANEPEQVIVLLTSADISTAELAKSLEIRLLPKRKVEKDAESTDESETEPSPEATPSSDERDAEAETEGEDDAYAAETATPDDEKWQSQTDVPDDVLGTAKLVQFTAVPTEKPQDRQHAFRIRVESDGELYVLVRKGVRALGDYPLGEDYNAIVTVPEMPREVQIDGQGGLLALNGERKLSVRSRGLVAIEYEIARVATTQINHLVSQTEGQFQSPEFQAPYFFNQENISRIARERQDIAMQNKWKANYSAFDFAGHLRKPADGGSERGLFFLTARGWDPVKKKPFKQIKDRRFLLITDIGIVTKKNADGGHDVFLLSIKNQKPIGNAAVDILGKNGVPVQSARTDADGHCTFPSVEKSEHEKSPVAFVARNGDDVAFIPYSREDRVLNFSRFDIEGVENALPENLDAFVFTERGVYRPGDEIHIGLIVKQRNWRGNLKGLPVETEVLDARGLKVQTRKLTLPETGFTELTYQTANESPTGLYTINVFLIKNSKRTTLLGSVTAQIKEFLPDRMKIDTRLSQSAAHGWIDPKDVRGTIGLANLYGTPATNRRVTGKIELAPTAFRFPEFRDFVFYDALLEEKKERQEQTVELGDKKTDDAGQAVFELQLERFADATYAMRFIAEGFEAEGGRSVTGDATALVSALPYVIGSKAQADLRYINMNQPRALDLIAVDPRLNRIALENITVNIIAREYVSVLTKQENGNYGFESVLKERVTKSEKIAISANGLHYVLPTDEPGNYIFELRDDQNRRLSKTQFSVVGQGAVSRSMEKNAELEVKLDQSQYNRGDDIAISITAPYAGSGLITIERDKVYAHQWFQTTSPSSVQHIRVPEGFEGSGYVNVAFVRALDSKEIFVSPLSYGVVPFTANMEKRRLKIDLQTAATVKPGEPLHIAYKTDRPSKIVIFAVEQGILQVTDYKTPDPLAFLFRKCALAVRTSQIVDLLIPEFSLLRSVSAFGGGGDIQRLNPFKRVTEKPVVFWSGIIDAGIDSREVVYNVPDYFDGTLKVMAVAVSPETTGSGERSALVRGPFIITPSVPVLAAPGDEFEAGVTVANNVEGSGPDAEIELRAETNEQLALVGSPNQKLKIAEGHEQSTSLRFHVNEKLGSGEIRFVASRNGTETRRRATLSVRPPVPFLTDVRSGSFKKASLEIPLTRQTYPEFRKRNAAVSALPLGLAHGLDAYLKNFPHGCSEQITSGAFCRLLLADEADFGLNRGEVNKQMEYTFGVLRRRQNDQGSFGYWAPETGDHISFISVYVMDFLSEAKAASFAPPEEMFSLGQRYLQKMVVHDPADLFEARTVAYAIYILTREGVITTNYILNLRDYLEKNQKDKWENDVTGVYLAGALHLLHKDAEAERLIAQYKIGRHAQKDCDDFYQSLGSDSQYIAVLAREFPARLKKISGEEFEKIVQPVSEGQFNTLSAAYAVRALKSYSHAVAQTLPELSIIELRANKTEARLTSGARLLQRHDFSGDARALRFTSAPPMSGPGAFFQVVEAGFDRQVPNQALSQGLEVYRELLGKDNQAATQTKLGETMHVRLHIRSLQKKSFTNVAIIDLLPGGFEIVDSSLRGGVSQVRGVDYVDLREDRAVFFATVPAAALEIDYQIKSCNRGQFVVPPVFAESMYDRNVKGRGLGGKITVTE
jgi:alpha-2-macroglobulin